MKSIERMKYLKKIYESQTKSINEQLEIIENIFLDYIDRGTCEIEQDSYFPHNPCFRVLLWGLLSETEYSYSSDKTIVGSGHSHAATKSFDIMKRNLQLEIKALDELQNIFKRLEYYGFKKYETYIEDLNGIEIFIPFLEDKES